MRRCGCRGASQGAGEVHHPGTGRRRGRARGVRTPDFRKGNGVTQFARWREIMWMLVLRDLQARSRQAYLGYFWILAQPLLMTGAFTFLVQRVLNRGDDTGVPYP